MMGEPEIAAFLNHLATDGRVSASTQNQALHALLFLYRHILCRDLGLIPGLTPAKRGRRLPVVLSSGEVRSILSRMHGVSRLCASLMYGSGLRLSECTQLRVKDIDFDRYEIMVRAGKGDKDRRVPLPRLVTPALKVQLERVQKQFEKDCVQASLERRFPTLSSESCRTQAAILTGNTYFRRRDYTWSAKRANAGAITFTIRRFSER
jgi:integrase